MAIDPRDLGEMQKALNDASGKASALWTTFVTFALYLAISFGSVTHRDLFLENPVKLPLLNVDLPLTAFFTVAPAVFVIFHFYVCLQLFGLARRAAEYNSLLRSSFRIESDRQIVRQRVDAFPVAQFLAGPRVQRVGLVGLSLRFIGWVTLVGAPVTVLLLAQLVFLPYHFAPVTWVQRVCVLVDLTVVWFIWSHIGVGDGPAARRLLARLRTGLGGAATCILVWFSAFVAYFPGEAIGNIGLDRVPITIDWSTGIVFRPLGEKMYVGANAILWDRTANRSSPFLANNIVLIDESFARSPSQSGATFVRSLRGRDFRGAVFTRSDMRSLDFSGADLTGAYFPGADLSGAVFGCTSPEDYHDDSCTLLTGANFAQARLNSATMDRAHLTLASLQSADLSGASLQRAVMVGADVRNARLTGAVLWGVDAVGASFAEADLAAADATRADFQLADFSGADLRSADMRRAYIEGASFRLARLQGAILGNFGVGEDRSANGVQFFGSKTWKTRARFVASILSDCRNVGESAGPLLPFEFDDLSAALEKITNSARRSVAIERLSLLAPTPESVAQDTEHIQSDIVHDDCMNYSEAKLDNDLAALQLSIACKRNYVTDKPFGRSEAAILISQITFLGSPWPHGWTAFAHERRSLARSLVSEALSGSECQSARLGLLPAHLAALNRVAEKFADP